MAAIDQPTGHDLTVREAAAACRLSPRTIRRKLNIGAFPNAYKAAGRDPEHDEVAWMIPFADLERAGLEPTGGRPTLTTALRSAADAEATEGAPTVLELVRSDRFGRLRAELAEAVAAAEIALLRAEAERWRVLADERAQALDRADNALKALTTAMGAGFVQGNAIAAPAAAPNFISPPPAPAPNFQQPVPTFQPVAAPPGGGQPRTAQGDIVAVPPLVRAEAMRYTATLQALHDMRRQQARWWQFWRT